MTDRLWTPKKVMPETAKVEGGTFFDDEMEDESVRQERFRQMTLDLIRHINQRPDHVVYVGSTDERHQMRTVFNSWKQGGLINHFPTIKIDYGVREGAIRVDEDRN